MAIAELAATYHGRNSETISLAEVNLPIEMPGFQRERKRAKIEKIAAEFDPTAFAFPYVAVWKGGLVCLDGQQRLTALESRGETTAWVLLLEGATSAARLADIFLKINRDRTLLSAFEKYVGALHSKDRGTVEISRLVEEHGLEVSSSATANGKVPAGAITRIHESYGVDVLKRVLDVREQAWGDDPAREANEAKTLVGLAQFLRRYFEKVDDARLVSILRKQHPGYILQAVDKKRGVSQKITYSDYLREQYNRGARGKVRI